MYNFCILQIVSHWDADCITPLVQQAIRLQYHLQSWMNAKDILIEKSNKRDLTLIKSCLLIGFFCASLLFMIFCFLIKGYFVAEVAMILRQAGGIF